MFLKSQKIICQAVHGLKGPIYPPPEEANKFEYTYYYLMSYEYEKCC